LKDGQHRDCRNTALATNLEEKRDRGRPRKRWQRVDAGMGQTTQSMEEDDDYDDDDDALFFEMSM
jgi:hypothetical protein